MSDEWRGADPATFMAKRLGLDSGSTSVLLFVFFSFLVSARAISDGIRYWALAGPFVRPSIKRKKIHTITRKHRGGAAYSQ
jgi:hypothetical protein